jgi:hypothetical protein
MLLPVSTTYTRPEGATAIPLGPEKFPKEKRKLVCSGLERPKEERHRILDRKKSQVKGTSFCVKGGSYLTSDGASPKTLCS